MSTSYHILKQISTNQFIWWWPISGVGEYCTNEAEAQAEFYKFCKEEPQDGYQLACYPAVIQDGKVIGSFIFECFIISQFERNNWTKTSVKTQTKKLKSVNINLFCFFNCILFVFL